jgi:hypothetical protein
MLSLFAGSQSTVCPLLSVEEPPIKACYCFGLSIPAHSRSREPKPNISNISYTSCIAPIQLKYHQISFTYEKTPSLTDISKTVKSSLAGYAINMRANDVRIRESDTVHADAGEPSISDVLSSFPGEVASVSHKLLQRIKGTLYQSEEGAI